MVFKAQRVPYRLTNNFSPIVLDYLNCSDKLKPFYSGPPNFEGIKTAIEEKKKHKVDRKLLTDTLRMQYSLVEGSEMIVQHINLLDDENTFTICTAHQPNLFTGPLYFMYKILHAIKLARTLKEKLPQYNFVPVYYMGSEDADFAELNHTYVRGKKIEWEKEQTGAVGRMTVDKTLMSLIEELQGQLYFEPHAGEVINLLKTSYEEGKDIQIATFELINYLYGQYGLLVLIPDNAALKRLMLPVFKEDLFNKVSSSVVAATSKALEKEYKVQANPREINLFYLKGHIRERIVSEKEGFIVHNTDIKFTTEEIEEELENYPERFSPNVILRGLYQETILPNIAFIGGGGEMAYWLQLKELFTHYSVPFPVLILRNSFLIVDKQAAGLMRKLGLKTEEIFASPFDLVNTLIDKAGKNPTLNGELAQVEELYQSLHEVATGIDATLSQHVAALKAKTVKGIADLGKKMMRSERKKHEVLQTAIKKLKENLFPLDDLQERVENFSSFHAHWGRAFIDELLEHSLSLEQEFIVLEEVDAVA